MIEETGKNVTFFKPGDRIWGDLSFPYGSGTFAEYVCIPEEALRLKPKSMSFEEAAAFPTAGVVALQHLLAKRQLQQGHKVLINGAGGSVGTFAIQIARHFGTEVTGVDRTDKMDMLLSLGADYVIDYSREDFTKNEEKYDLILDVTVRRWIFDYKRALNTDGVCLMVGGSMIKVFTNILLGKLSGGEKKVGLGTWKPNRKEDLDYLQQLFKSGEVQKANIAKEKTGLLKEKSKNLSQIVKRWHKANRVRNFVNELERKLIKENALTDEKKNWIRWALDKADKFDPMIKIDNLQL